MGTAHCLRGGGGPTWGNRCMVPARRAARLNVLEAISTQ